jgi:steroid 5-alpha reductase family enzyme
MEGSARWSRGSSFWFVFAAYVAALVAAIAFIYWHGSAQPVRAAILADLLCTFVVFAFSIALNNGSTYDPYWSVAPPFILLYWVACEAPGVPGLRQVLVGVLVFAWAIRLTWNWARGWPGLHHEDWRYTMLYAEAPMPKWAISLLGIHLLPTVQVILGCLPLISAVMRGTNPVGLLDLVATVVTGGAVMLELIADEQLRAFNRTKQPGEIMNRGLWAYSRHPNYLGEIAFWCGLFLFGLAADRAYAWTIIGPLAMVALFLFASIPMLDRRSVERRPGYAEHMQRVSTIIPWFPKRGAA